jgi:cytochrome c-type biogenesis protein CcmH
MSMAPALSFAIGAAAALLSLVILIPIRTLGWRAGLPPKLGALLAFMAPLIAVTVLTTRSAPPAITSLATPVASTASETGLRESEWATLAHAYLGGPPPSSGDTAPVVERAVQDVAQLEKATRSAPENPQHWLALAQTQRLARDFPAAVKAYETALKLDDRNADAWADYADALASANNRRLAGAPAKAIARTLALDPKHLKGLWLAASLDLEQHRYRDALGRWQQLRAALPEGSPDIAIIDANIAEASGMAKSNAGNPGG